MAKVSKMELKPEHEVFFKHLVDNGCISKEQCQHYGVTSTKVLKFNDKGFIERKDFTNPFTHKKSSVYVLTKEGKRFVETRLGHKHFYRSNSIPHDFVKAEFYCFKLDDFQREHYMNANEFTENFKHVMGTYYDKEKYSMIDGAYPVDRTLKTFIGHDVITDSYSNEDEDAKAAACEALGMKFESIDI